MTAHKEVQEILNRRFDDLALIDEALVADGAHEKARDNAREHGNKGLALIGDALLRLVIVDDCMIAGYSTAKQSVPAAQILSSCRGRPVRPYFLHAVEDR